MKAGNEPVPETGPSGAPLASESSFEASSLRPGAVLIVLAAGSSSRMNSGALPGTPVPDSKTPPLIKKEFLPLKSGTVLSECVKAFLNAAPFSQVIIAIPKDTENEARQALLQDGETAMRAQSANLTFCEGGATRGESVFNALQAVRKKECVVLIHDGARPFVSESIIREVLSAASLYGAACPAITPADTQKEIGRDGAIKTHLDRTSIRAVQTPQGFAFPAILECYRRAIKSGMKVTDDTQVWDAFPDVTGGRRVILTEGSAENKKITFRSDIAYAQGEARAEPKTGRGKEPPESEFRVGLGEDFHTLIKGRPLMIGGVLIPSERGEDAHSDGDALLHAIGDALLGAARLGDIGSYFPPEDDRWRGAKSSALLGIIARDVRNAGWRIGNIDCVVELEVPKLLPYREKIIASICGILGEESCPVFVKAKTNEKRGDIGQGRAIRALCVCLLSREI